MSELSKRLSLSELEKLPEYIRLTPKQKLFVATYCEGGLVDGNYDPIAATQTAYQCKSLEIARVMSYALLANIRIIAILNRHFGTTPSEAFLEIVDRAIHNKKLTVTQMDAIRLKARLLGFDSGILPMNSEYQDARKKARREKRKQESGPIVVKTKPTPSQYDNH
jgi:hypothetical protein